MGKSSNEHKRAYAKRSYWDRKLAGLCVKEGCTSPAGDTNFCEFHRVKACEETARRYEQSKAMRLAWELE